MLALLRPGASAASRIDALAAAALADELACYPKPGLVSPVDSGSHADMDAATFRASIAALAGYFGAMAEAGAEGAAFPALNALGRAAEARMLAATGGVNTHRGAVFSLGLAAAAAGGSAPERGAAAICRTVADRWGADILAAGRLAEQRTHGAAVRARYGAPGAREEAAAGFPTVIGHALPAFRMARRAGASRNDALVQALFAILSVLEDNNLLYRGGPAALGRAQRRALNFLASGGILARGGRALAVAIHRAFVAERMSPGGAADLLALTAFLARVEEAHPGP
ncbi:triphosphoribosyl-dephospho-CoA synthase MdcB [Methylobacterium dankookense]|uniref:Probable 2-(5''-triphosphoribosyl)-3'-dephosphocoenzyme-A synthase n=1 Tax=Methylobacterium dankookense TaxID=560405 RepID=A0A564FYM4_9HYPH|nr:triphosphoribosyl-dephospho-CoA synthase MdcB [Methylobacterium dankookense]GJD55646.1 2-(5''-triphosphoribosyl)-3'-dephosphocoenzyme-A synthase [Methylobacterium dankookense]VUF12800.1 2-(5''-triphosphoribosyl)-3'-dephosphocoenzyme-A synthase [Methylobacterium dankookense]